MSLTLGTGPFGKHPAGRFNFERSGPESVLYWEPYPKRIRAAFGGAFIADSRRMMALHETGHLMVLYFPREDVAMDRLEASDHRTTCPHKGAASYWSVRAGDRVAENAAWSYEDPIPSARPMAGYIAFSYRQMDAWYQEDERIYAHPRDPYHRFDVHAASCHVVVRHNGEVIAETDRPRILFETALPPFYYLPREDVRTDLLERSEMVTHCPYKGDSRHWHILVGGETIRNAAWSIPEPLGEADRVAGCYSFYPGKVDVEVDGEKI